MARKASPRTKIAACGTVAALGALAAVAAASNPGPEQPAPAAAVAQVPRTRTVVVHRTVDVPAPAAKVAAPAPAPAPVPAPAAARAAARPVRAAAPRRPRWHTKRAAPLVSSHALPEDIAASVTADQPDPCAPDATAGGSPDTVAGLPIVSASGRRGAPVKTSHPLPEDDAATSAGLPTCIAPPKETA